MIQHIGKVNYLVDMADRRKRRKIFHINMLRKWNEPASHNYFVEEKVGDGEDLEALAWNGGEGEPVIGEQLSLKQKQELQRLLHRHRSSLTQIPGRISVVEHGIPVGDEAPIPLPPYRLPHAYRDHVKEE